MSSKGPVSILRVNHPTTIPRCSDWKFYLLLPQIYSESIGKHSSPMEHMGLTCATLMAQCVKLL